MEEMVLPPGGSPAPKPRPAFFDGQQGVQRLPPLAQRLATDFATDARFDSPRAVQLRLSGFDLERLAELGGRFAISTPGQRGPRTG